MFGTFHWIGFLAILLLGGRLHPLIAPEILEIESE
jgi:hypothetical protein